MRSTQDHVDQWREDGFCVLENFFTPEEYEPVLADFEEIYRDLAQPEEQAMRRVLEEGDDVDLNRATQF